MVNVKTMVKPQVTVIMPCYNRARYLREAIDSVLKQTFSGFELIIVDDGSTDGSAAIIAEYGDKVRAITQENRGRSAARNAAIQVSRGAYLAFLDADDYWHPDFLQRMLAVLEGTDAAVAYCGWQNVGLPGRRGEPFIPPDYEQKPDKEELLFENTRWPIHAAVVRGDLVRRVGGFDGRWQSCEDFALWLEIGLRQRIIRVPYVLAFYRHHGDGQITTRRALMAVNHYLVQQDYLRRHKSRRRAWGRRKVRTLMQGELLRRAYVCYWDRDLSCARKLFRLVMRSGYGDLRDWKYMLPSLLPFPLHQRLIRIFEQMGEASA